MNRFRSQAGLVDVGGVQQADGWEVGQVVEV